MLPNIIKKKNDTSKQIKSFQHTNDFHTDRAKVIILPFQRNLIISLPVELNATVLSHSLALIFLLSLSLYIYMCVCVFIYIHIYVRVRFRSRVPDNDPYIPLEAPQQPTMRQACQSKPELAFWL